MQKKKHLLWSQASPPPSRLIRLEQTLLSRSIRTLYLFIHTFIHSTYTTIHSYTVLIHPYIYSLHSTYSFLQKTTSAAAPYTQFLDHRHSSIPITQQRCRCHDKKVTGRQNEPG